MNRKTATRWVKRFCIWGLLGCAVGAGAWYWRQHPALEEAPRYLTAKVLRGEMVQVVTASGQLNPVVRVEVGSQISGIVENLLVDFNAPVKEGQLIAQIDPSIYEANFIQAEGNLASARAGLELARLNESRTKSLRAAKLNAESEYDKALADLHQAEAVVKIYEGALKKAQVDLAHCKIFAPVDGVVISRNVNIGQTVAASLSAPTLFVIANDLSKMQIEAEVAEADIGQVEVGQDVDFTVDALPGQTTQGKVTQIRYAPNTNQNVVTYNTIVQVSNPNMKLLPGMTANVSINVTRRSNVLKIPNAAFRFRPPKTVEVAKASADKASASESAAPGEKKADSPKPKKDKRKSERTAYLLTDGVLKSVKLKLGITDGRETEVIEGLKEGDTVVVDLVESKPATTVLSRLFTSSGN